MNFDISFHMLTSRASFSGKHDKPPFLQLASLYRAKQTSFPNLPDDVPLLYLLQVPTVNRDTSTVFEY